MEKIKVGICGYGNLGKSVEKEIIRSKDMELVAIFTKRDPESLEVKSNVQKVKYEDAASWKDKIDVMIMCGGSATDLPEQVPEMAKFFNTVDSFDTHAKIPEYLKKVNEVAKANNHVSIISAGWDPGLFSIIRGYTNSILKDGTSYTFWGKGVSQGHSQAIRSIPGVKDAIQYTIPRENAIERVRAGGNPELSVSDKHLRDCYVVAKEGADKEKIENAIKTMPHYFDEYETIVHFISEEELKKKHSKLSHGGFVIHSGSTNDGQNKHLIEFSLKLDSNPDFTGSVLIAYARANYKLKEKNDFGAKTIFEVPTYLLYEDGLEDLVKKYL